MSMAARAAIVSSAPRYRITESLRILPSLLLALIILPLVGVQDTQPAQDTQPVVVPLALSTPLVNQAPVQLAAAPPVDVQPAPGGAQALSDQELGQVSAGDFEFELETFDVVIQDNQAGMFTLDIARSAFGGAQGLFTTLQAVNSAVDLTVIVNIILNQTGS